MNIEQEITELKNRIDELQACFIAAQRNQVPITAKTDENYAKVPQIDENTQGVHENDSAIVDVAELSDENSNAIEDLAEIVDELMNKVEELEGN